MEVLIGKPSMNGPFSMAMLNTQMVYYTHKEWMGSPTKTFKVWMLKIYPIHQPWSPAWGPS